MTKINNQRKETYIGGKGPWKYSRTMNVAFGAATLGSAINSIFDMVNTSNYLNNQDPQNYANPYQSHGAKKE